MAGSRNLPNSVSSSYPERQPRAWNGSETECRSWIGAETQDWKVTKTSRHGLVTGSALVPRPKNCPPLWKEQPQEQLRVVSEAGTTLVEAPLKKTQDLRLPLQTRPQEEPLPRTLSPT